MISVEEALAKILREVSPLEAESVPLLASLGQVMAEDIVSGINVPPLDNSAFDGYAIRSEDTRGAGTASPKKLRVIATVMAGAICREKVAPGTAVRIMTGAPVPEGADAVVPFEDTDEEKQKAANHGRPITEIGVPGEVPPGDNIRRAGEDIAGGAVVLKAGKVIRPAEIGLMASLGYTEVKAVRRPVVAILATGNELVETGRPLPEGNIYNSNTYSIAALVQRYGGVPKILGIARDSADSLVEKFRGLDADMLLTIGGVSMGDYDMVKDVLAAEGEMVFWKVRMKPGKPLAFGTLKSHNGTSRRIPHFGLPGNPVSCMVGFEIFVRPAMLRMMGKKNLEKPTVAAVMEDSLENRGGRRLYDRAVITRRDGRYYARLTGPQGSHMLTSMSQANGLVIIPEDRIKVEKGETLPAIMLDWNEEVY